MVTRYVMATVLVVLLGYGIFEAYPLIAGPSLIISSPENGTASASGIVTVSGRALRISALSLDGAPVLPEQDGAFSVALTLPAGGSILTLVARDRFGRSVTKTREIYVP